MKSNARAGQLKAALDPYPLTIAIAATLPLSSYHYSLLKGA